MHLVSEFFRKRRSSVCCLLNRNDISISDRFLEFKSCNCGFTGMKLLFTTYFFSFFAMFSLPFCLQILNSSAQPPNLISHIDHPGESLPPVVKDKPSQRQQSHQCPDIENYLSQIGLLLIFSLGSELI